MRAFCLAIVLVLLLNLLSLSVLAKDTQPAFTYSSVTLSAYITNLIARADYYRAITETYRWHFLYNNRDEGKDLERDLGWIYFKAGNYPVSRSEFFEYLNKGRPVGDDAEQVKFLIARTYEKEKDFRNAYYQMEAVHFKAGSEEDYTARLKRLEYRVKYPVTDRRMLAPAWFELTNSSRTNIAALKEKYSAELKLLDGKMNEAGHIRTKSPFVTGLCSVVPGLNMIYLGRYRQGLINFVAHAALIGLTWFEFDRKEYVGGIILGLTEISWYYYNFSNGFDQLRNYNKAQERRFQASFSLDIPF